MEKIYKNILKTRALMLVVLASIFAFGANAQTINTATFPAAPQFAGEEATFTYNASGFDAGTTFILWDDADTDGLLDVDETIFGQSTTQDTDVDLTFTLPDNDVEFAFNGFSGNVIQGEIVDADEGQIVAIGSDDISFSYYFFKTSLRQLTTGAFDASSTEQIKLRVGLTSFGLDVDNPVEVRYSIDGFATAGTVLADINTDEEFTGSGFYEFILPSAAKTAATSFRIVQTGTVDYGINDKDWQVNSIDLEIGEDYAQPVPAELQTASLVITNPFINITSVTDDQDNPTNDFFVGDVVKINGELQNVDFTGLNFTAVLINTADNSTYALESETLVKNNTTKEFTIEGTIPADLEYNDGALEWDFEIVPYEGSEPLAGLDIFVDLTADDLSDFTISGGEQTGSGVVFDEATERLIQAPALNVTSQDGVFTMLIARKNNVLSPAGTDIIVEYSVDGGNTFTELTSLEINEITASPTFTEVVFDTWPAGVVNSNTIFQVRQEGNNGADLDAFIIESLEIQNETNFVSESTITRDNNAVSISSPDLTIDPIEVGGDGQAFPMEELSLTYTINDGVFPANTAADVYLDRDGGGNDPMQDLRIGSTTDISTGTITITVPPIEAGDYNVYIVTLNDREYDDNIFLSIFDLGLQIVSIDFADPVSVAGEDFTYPGSSITVNYSVQGTPGAEAQLELSVFDENPDVNDWVTIATTTTIDGAITATLPVNIDYTDPTNARLTITNGGVFSNNIFDVIQVNQSFLGSPIPEEFYETLSGAIDDNVYPDELAANGTRAIVSAPIDFQYGGILGIEFISTDDFAGTFDFTLEGSIDGENWIEMDDFQYTFTGTFDFDYNQASIPNDMWSETFQWRLVYNEDGAFAEGVNAVKFDYLLIRTPEFLETSETTAPFNLLRPDLSVNAYESTSFIVGESVEINYNATGFAAGTEIAAVIEQGDEYYVAGTSAQLGAGTISAMMPVAIPFGDNDELDPYDLKIVPFTPATAGGAYMQGETIDVEDEEDYLIIEGDRLTTNFAEFDFDRAGDRVLLTRAFDFSGAQSVTLNFEFNEGPVFYPAFDINSNKNLVPRLEVSIDAGQTFQVINVEDLAPDEEPMFDTGLLYEDRAYSVEIPAEFITSATHFRWSQPLNLGENASAWSLENISIEVNSGNEFDDVLYTTTANNPTGITLGIPNLENYLFTQVDLQDPVFNNETFQATFDVVEGIDANFVDGFPSGSTFEFYLYDGGNAVIDPNTNLPLIIGTSTALGAFEASVPGFVENGTYQVRLAASVTIDNEKIFYIGDEEGSDDQVGTLDVFLRAVKTTMDFDENDILYAGSTVTILVDIENDETNAASDENIFSNLLIRNYSGGDDLILATEAGIVSSFTVDLPPFLINNREFVVEFSEAAPLGEPLDLVGESNLENIQEDGDNFISGKYENVHIYTVDNENDLDIRSFNGNFRIEGRVDNNTNSNVRIQIVRDDGALLLNGSLGIGTNRSFDYQVNRFSFAEGGDFEVRFVSDEPIDFDSFFDIDFVQYYDAFDNAPFKSFGSGEWIPDNAFPNAETGVAFENDLGRGVITTRDFEVGELEDATLLEFDLTFDEIPENMTTSQFLTLEYSIDGGANYTEIGSYPEADEEDPLDQENILVELTEEMKTNTVRFRWRQEERAGIDVAISNISFIFGSVIPFDYISDFQQISRQRLLVTSIGAAQGCLQDAITIGYEVRGRMGADNIVTVSYEERGGGVSGTLDAEFNAFEGTGEVSVQLPSDLFSTLDDNKEIEFRLNFLDRTFEDDFFQYSSSNEPISDDFIEIIAPIFVDAEFSVSDPLACEGEDVVVSVDDLQEYFMYEILDADGNVLGSTTYDPEVNNSDEINIGQVTGLTNLSMRITSMTADGQLTCNTLTSTFTDTVEPLADFQLYYDAEGDNIFRLATPDLAFDVCNAGGTGVLRIERLLANGSRTIGGFTDVEWFRDDLNNPVNAGTSLERSEIAQSGAYFARVTTGSCVYTTESVQLNVAEQPDQPTITVVSGDLTGCDSSDPVVLEAPAGFEYYLWNTGARTQSIEVENPGSYSVQVSNIPFGNGCSSISSAIVQVERADLPSRVTVSRTTGFDEDENIGAGETIRACDGVTLFFLEEDIWGNNTFDAERSIAIFRDGTAYATVEGAGSPSFFFTEGGNYTFEWSHTSPNVDCTLPFGDVIIEIEETPTEVPVLTSTGDLAFCAEEGQVTLTAPEGFTKYRWFRNGGQINGDFSDNFDDTNNTFVVSTSGRYAVQVGNLNGCWSPISNYIEVEARALPPIATAFQVEGTCGAGVITFQINGTADADVVYQLINGETGQPSGNPVRGEGTTTFIESAPVDQLTEFYLETSWVDGSGCTNSDPDVEFFGQPNNVVLEIEGATLEAIVSDWNEVLEIRWFRNDVEIVNRRGDQSITVLDNATYNVQVEFAGGCVISSNAIDLGEESAELQTFFGDFSITAYPNPTVDQLKVDMKGGSLGEFNLTLMNMSGQVVMSFTVDKQVDEVTEILDLQTVEKGVYNLRVERGNQVQNVRIVKQ